MDFEKRARRGGRKLQKAVDRILVRHYREVEKLDLLGLVVRFNATVPELRIVSMHVQTS